VNALGAWVQEHLSDVIVALVAGIALAGGAVWWWRPLKACGGAGLLSACPTMCGVVPSGMWVRPGFTTLMTESKSGMTFAGTWVRL